MWQPSSPRGNRQPPPPSAPMDVAAVRTFLPVPVSSRGVVASCLPPPPPSRAGRRPIQRRARSQCVDLPPCWAASRFIRTSSRCGAPRSFAFPRVLGHGHVHPCLGEVPVSSSRHRLRRPSRHIVPGHVGVADTRAACLIRDVAGDFAGDWRKKREEDEVGLWDPHSLGAQI